MWDLNIRRRVLSETEGMSQRAAMKVLSKYGVGFATLRYWRRCQADGHPDGHYGQANHHIAKVVRRELKKHIEEYHQ